MISEIIVHIQLASWGDKKLQGGKFLNEVLVTSCWTMAL